MSLTDIFQNIANAIRSKTGNTESIYPANMATEIEQIDIGGASRTQVLAGVANKSTISIRVYESEV